MPCQLAHRKLAPRLFVGKLAGTMQDEKLRRALLKVENITQFCAKHDLRARTVFRAKVEGVSLSPAIRKLLRLALIQEGHLSGDEKSTTKGRVARKRPAGRKVGRRHSP
jgi:hypothetical protein